MKDINVHFLSPCADAVYGKRTWPHVARPPLTLTYLAAPLLKMGIHVRLLDFDLDYSPQSYFEQLVKEKPDVVAFSLVTPLFSSTQELIQKIKEYSPRSLVVVGGPHATALPHDTLTRLPADVVCAGAGQSVFTRLIKALQEGEKPTAVLKEFITLGNLEASGHPFPGWKSFPLPARELLELDKYRDYFDGRLVPHITLFSSYGCIGQCRFCSGAGNRIESRDMIEVVDEIEHCIRHYGIHYFVFEDDTFGIPAKRMHSFARQIKERQLSISYVCHVRLDCISRDTLDLMKETGCVKVMPGIESGSDEILSSMGKQLTKEKILQGINLLKEYRFDIRGTFILGWVDETLAQMEQTISFARELGLTRASFNIATPLPGTWLWEEALRKKMLTEPVDFSQFSFYTKPVANLSKVPNEQLYALCKEANRQMRKLD